VYEYPEAEGEPYYPIPRPENSAIYERYRALAAVTAGVYFCGRLANYRYFNMDQVVAQALHLFRDIAADELEAAPVSSAKLTHPVVMPAAAPVLAAS
jgi:UDP-galactopyranose mutase